MHLLHKSIRSVIEATKPLRSRLWREKESDRKQRGFSELRAKSDPNSGTGESKSVSISRFALQNPPCSANLFNQTDSPIRPTKVYALYCHPSLLGGGEYIHLHKD